MDGEGVLDCLFFDEEESGEYMIFSCFATCGIL